MHDRVHVDEGEGFGKIGDVDADSGIMQRHGSAQQIPQQTADHRCDTARIKINIDAIQGGDLDLPKLVMLAQPFGLNQRHIKPPAWRTQDSAVLPARPGTGRPAGLRPVSHR